MPGNNLLVLKFLPSLREAEASRLLEGSATHGKRWETVACTIALPPQDQEFETQYQTIQPEYLMLASRFSKTIASEGANRID
jgi:hypothetical protein